MGTGDLPQNSDRAQEFMELYSVHQRRLYYYIVTLCANADDANDVLGETNLAAWEHFDQFEPGTNFFAWIRQIARHRVLIHRRGQFRDTLVLEPHVLEQVAERLGDEGVVNTAIRDALEACMSKLGVSDRTLIQQRYTCGSSVKSLATDLGRSPNALSKSLGRIRGRLYDCIRSVLARDERGGE